MFLEMCKIQYLLKLLEIDQKSDFEPPSQEKSSSFCMALNYCTL